MRPKISAVRQGSKLTPFVILVMVVSMFSVHVVLASPPMERCLQSEHRSRLKVLVSQGCYVEALDALVAFPGREPHASLADTAFSLARASELLIFVDDPALYKEYLKRLEPMQNEIRAALDQHPKLKSDLEHTLALYSQAMAAEIRVADETSCIVEIERRLASQESFDLDGAKMLIRDIVAVRDNEIAIKLTESLLLKMPANHDTPDQYRPLYAHAMLVEEMNSSNPIRAIGLAKDALKLVAAGDFSPETELSSKAQNDLRLTVGRLRSTAKNEFWESDNHPHSVDSG